LKGKFIGNDITITKIFFLDTREVTKTRPTTSLKLKDFFAENARHDYAFFAQLISVSHHLLRKCLLLASR
jgi:hypothetical protein